MNDMLVKRNEPLFAKLVPSSGKCDTLEGEILRSVNRLCYRWYNDGDYWYEGYGTETAGCAETFLRLYSPVNVTVELNASYGKKEDDYDAALDAVLDKVLTYIEGRAEFTSNRMDMLDCEPQFNDEPQFDDEPEDDDEPEEDDWE